MGERRERRERRDRRERGRGAVDFSTKDKQIIYITNVNSEQTLRRDGGRILIRRGAMLLGPSSGLVFYPTITSIKNRGGQTHKQRGHNTHLEGRGGPWEQIKCIMMQSLMGSLYK